MEKTRKREDKSVCEREEEWRERKMRSKEGEKREMKREQRKRTGVSIIHKLPLHLE